MATINKSILNKNNFRLLIDRIPTVEYYVQTVNIPGLTMNETIMGSRIGLDGYFPGDKITFDTLDITFLVDEDLANFKEMYDWMDAIVPVKDSSAYSNLVGGTSTSTNVTANKKAGMEQYSDITLVMNTNKNIRFIFVGNIGTCLQRAVPIILTCHNNNGTLSSEIESDGES